MNGPIFGSENTRIWGAVNNPMNLNGLCIAYSSYYTDIGFDIPKDSEGKCLLSGKAHWLNLYDLSEMEVWKITETNE